MQQFRADSFWSIGILIGRVSMQYGKYDSGRKMQARAEDTAIVQVHQDIVKRCDEIGLTISSKCANAIVDELKDDDFTVGQFRESLAQLENTIRWEMEDKLFMYIPPERAVRYDQKELLSKEVNAKFPTIHYDVVEAGNCYACARSTAVAFHLMRIMEAGVQAFGTKLGIKLVNEKVWQVILDGINAVITKLPKKEATTVELCQIAANLYSVKLAWRNEVMHPKDTYTLEEADNLIRQVKLFMEQLAKVI